MGHVYAFLTATKVTFRDDEESTEENGWVDPNWSLSELHESRNDVRPVVDFSDDPDQALQWYDTYEELVTEAVVGTFETAFLGYAESNGDGTFYDTDCYSPLDEDTTYTYALHWTVKRQDGAGRWVEEAWDPTIDGGLDLKALNVTR